jgi:hypothetical protein
MDERKEKLTTCCADIEPEEPEYLWFPYIIRNEINVLCGDPAVGKSFLTTKIVALLSKGLPFPGNPLQDNAVIGTTVFFNGEESPKMAIVPRLIMNGADRSQIHVVNPTKNHIHITDPRFEQIISDIRPILVIIDPLQSWLGKHVDANRANQTRPILDYLRSLAEKYQFTPLIIEHLNKNPNGKAIYRASGSIDIVGAARSVLLAGVDHDDENNRAIIHVKASYVKKGAPVDYKINDQGTSFCNTALNENALLYGVSDNKYRKDDAAKDFLRKTLKGGEQELDDIKAAAAMEGISYSMLRKAKAALNVKDRQVGRAPKRKTFWAL